MNQFVCTCEPNPSDPYTHTNEFCVFYTKPLPPVREIPTEDFLKALDDAINTVQGIPADRPWTFSLPVLMEMRKTFEQIRNFEREQEILMMELREY